MSYVVKNWKEHQHYKNRRPPWIKLHRTLLDDCNYLRLQPASRALAPLMWLLASEGVNGVVEGEAADLAFRLRLTESEVQDGLNGLLSIGYITRYQDASDVLAPCKQEARPETEREGEKETEGEAYIEARGGSTPPRDGLLGMADLIRGCRPEYRAIKEQSIVNSLSAVQDRQALEAELEIWIAEHSNMLVAMNNPMASLHKLIYRLCRKEADNGAK